jgi:hypothetical protein
MGLDISIGGLKSLNWLGDDIVVVAGENIRKERKIEAFSSSVTIIRVPLPLARGS